MVKPLEKMSERDWRIFREDCDILVKGGRVPNPIRNWNEIDELSKDLRENLVNVCGYKKPMPI